MFSIDITIIPIMISTVLVATNVVTMTLYLTSNCRNKQLQKQCDEYELTCKDLNESKCDLEEALQEKENEIKNLKILHTALDKWSEHYKNQIVELEANLWTKNDENEKLSKRVELLEKECKERKFEAVKLRGQIKTYQQQIRLSL